MSIMMSALTIDTLLDKLSSDDAFRCLFQRSPRQALAAIGHVAAADPNHEQGVWNCMQVKHLASKEAIGQSRDFLRMQLLTTQANQKPHSLDDRMAIDPAVRMSTPVTA